MSERDDAPYLRPFSDGDGHWVAVLVVLILAILGTASYYLRELWVIPESHEAVIAEKRSRGIAPPKLIGGSRPFHIGPSNELPAATDSDAMVGRSISEIVGSQAFRDFVVPDQLVRRIVATVDNLPRSTAPRRVMPFNQVPGALIVRGEGSTVALDEANSLRYRPYVNVFMAIDVPSLVHRYIATYPVFQRAYAELGYPGERFHGRLLAAIDDMLAAPEPAEPVQLERPKVLYQFVDPELESLSAGQKIMIRMGIDNELRIKGKLRELRKALVRTAL